jgi:predicted DNA-binding transcriptional regulator YafY
MLPSPEEPRFKQRFQRLQKIIEMLSASTQGMTTKELLKSLEKLGVPYAVKERRLYEDLHFLMEEVDSPMIKKNEGYYQAILPEHYVFLSEQEALFCLGLVTSIGNSLLHKSTQKYKNALLGKMAQTHPKITEKINSPVRQLIIPTVRTIQDDDDLDDGISVQLITAIEQRKQVNITFKENQLGKVIGCYPLRLIFYIRSWYLIAYCNPPTGLNKKMKRELCSFRLDNIHQVEMLFANFTLTSKMNVDEALDCAWGLNFYAPIRPVILRFRQDLVPHIERNRRHPSAILEKQSDGSLMYKAQYYQGSLDFMQWIRQYGAGVEVIEPEELRQEVIQDLKQALDCYL